MNTVLYARSAQTDLLEAWVYIADEDLNAADRLLDTIEAEAAILATQPLMGRELATGIRSWPTSTPYVLFYRADPDGITVVRVLHHARDIRETHF